MKRTLPLAIAVLLGICCAANAADEAKKGATPVKDVDLGAVATEGLLMKVDGAANQMALWYPFRFLVESYVQQNDASRADAEKDLAYLKPYILVLVQCSLDQEDLSSVYLSEDAVKARAVIRRPDNTDLKPIPNPPALISATAAALKAIISSEGDAGSANMHVLIFPNDNGSGQPLIDENAKGSLKLVLKSTPQYKTAEFVWRTPFDSLTSNPPCGHCKQEVSAKWSFCPWCGTRLP